MRSVRETIVFGLGMLALWAIVAHCTACKSFPSAAKEVEAESRYGADQFKECVAPEPILGASATYEQRAAAWARVDACRARVQARWGFDGGVQ